MTRTGTPQSHTQVQTPRWTPVTVRGQLPARAPRLHTEESTGPAGCPAAREVQKAGGGVACCPPKGRWRGPGADLCYRGHLSGHQQRRGSGRTPGLSRAACVAHGQAASTMPSEEGGPRRAPQAGRVPLLQDTIRPYSGCPQLPGGPACQGSANSVVAPGPWTPGFRLAGQLTRRCVDLAVLFLSASYHTAREMCRQPLGSLGRVSVPRARPTLVSGRHPSQEGRCCGLAPEALPAFLIN